MWVHCRYFAINTTWKHHLNSCFTQGPSSSAQLLPWRQILVPGKAFSPCHLRFVGERWAPSAQQLSAELAFHLLPPFPPHLPLPHLPSLPQDSEKPHPGWEWFWGLPLADGLGRGSKGGARDSNCTPSSLQPTWPSDP